MGSFARTLFSRTLLSTSDFQSEVGGKFSAKLVANFRRSLEGDFRASFAGGNRQKNFPPKLHRKFHHQTSLQGSGLWWALHFCLDQFSVIQDKLYTARCSNTSFGRTLLGSNFGGLLLEQTFCRHFAAFPNNHPSLFFGQKAF